MFHVFIHFTEQKEQTLTITNAMQKNHLQKYMFSLCLLTRSAEISDFGHSNESNLHQRTPAQQKSNMQNCHPSIEKGGSLGFKLLFYNSLRDLAALDYKESLLCLMGYA